MELSWARTLCRVLACAAIPILSATLAACGEGDGDGRASATKRQFIEQADARCKATNERVQGLLAVAAADPAAAVIETLPALEALVADLHALPAPAGDPELQAIMAEFDRALSQFRTVERARKARDEVAVQRMLNQLQVESAEFERQTARYGFKVCGQE